MKKKKKVKALQELRGFYDTLIARIRPIQENLQEQSDETLVAFLSNGPGGYEYEDLVEKITDETGAFETLGLQEIVLALQGKTSGELDALDFATLELETTYL